MARTSRRVRTFLWLGGTTVLLALLVLVGPALWVRRKEAPYLYNDLRAIPARDVAIVLGASVYRSGRPSPVVESRLVLALALLQAGKVRAIHVSGDHRPDVYDEVEAMGRWLVRNGVRADQIVLDRAGLRTWDSMARASAIYGVKNAVVCTQAFHLPRATFLARQAGIDAVGLQAGAPLADTGWRDLLRESLATVRAIFDVKTARPR